MVTNMPSVDLFEALESLRSVRRLSAQPVPREALERLVHYATRAPSAGNGQPWEFVVVTRPDLTAQIGALYREASEALFEATANASGTSESKKKIYRDAAELSRSMSQVPAIIVALHNGPPAAGPGTNPVRYGSIFPAVQNLLLAAHGLGLGALVTTVHAGRIDREIQDLLGIPEQAEIAGLIPVGYPELTPEPTPRKAVAEVLHWDTYRSGPLEKMSS